MTSKVFDEHAARFAVQGWLASRLVLTIIALGLTWTQGWAIWEVFSRWDSAHFIQVSMEGYSLQESAFFPGLPMIMALFSLVGVAPWVTGVVLSWVSSGMAAWALYRLAGGSIRGLVAVLAWSFAPMAVFTFVPYTEAVFCALAFWAFLYAKRDRFGIAAALAAGACLFRVSGLFLIGALGLVALFGIAHSTWKQRLLRSIWMMVPFSVLVGYTVYLRVKFGTWTIWFQSQSEGWGRHFDWPWKAFLETLRAAFLDSAGHEAAVMFKWELLVFALGLVIIISCFARKQIAEGGWVMVQWLALSCQSWIISMTRATLLWFPVFVLIGGFASRNLPKIPADLRRGVVVLALGLEALVMVWWAFLHFSGAWSG